MPEEHLDKYELQPIKIKWLTFVLLFATVYATMRYIVFKGVELSHYPLYIVNKIFSISGLFFLALSYSFNKIKRLTINGHSRPKDFIKFTGLAGFSLSAMHVLISLAILSPEYYPKFYNQNMMNFTGELSMLFGVLSLYFFTIPAISTIPFMQEAVGIKKWQQGQRMGYIGLWTALLHTAIMGYSGWLDISTWPGYMPSISLLAVIIAAVPLYLKFFRNK